MAVAPGPHHRRVRLRVAALVVGMVLSGCILSPSADKSGGDGPPLTLHMATSEQRGDSPMVPAFDYFAKAVQTASGERLHVTMTYGAQGNPTAKSDQVVAGMVQQGKYDLALVPARSWDALGVSSLRPLQTPFLVDSDDLVDEIVRSRVADELTAGLSDAGVHALVLWPEGLRHPVGFGHPLLTRQDFQRATLSALFSKDVYAMLRALGSDPVWLGNSSSADAAYAAGRLQGAERGTNYAGSGPSPTMTADVTLYAKIDTIVVNDDSWRRLTDEQRSILEQAAQQTRDWLVDTRVREAEALQALCDAGTGVTLAGPAAAAAIRQETEPLTDQMRADPGLGPVIDEIEALKDDVVPDPQPPPECAVATVSTDIGPLVDPAVLDGTYRTSFTEEELVAHGDQYARNDAGVWTIILDGGRYSEVSFPCLGTYEVSATMVTFTFHPKATCSGDWTARWQRTRTGGLRFIDVQSAASGDRAIWGLHEWKQLEE
jgi:TRAP-type C4-dicarboxylate transport system substrate-binding protein